MIQTYAALMIDILIKMLIIFLVLMSATTNCSIHQLKQGWPRFWFNETNYHRRFLDATWDNRPVVIDLKNTVIVELLASSSVIKRGCWWSSFPNNSSHENRPTEAMVKVQPIFSQCKSNESKQHWSVNKPHFWFLSVFSLVAIVKAFWIFKTQTSIVLCHS